MLKKRIITAMILIPLTLVVLFYLPTRAFAFLMGFITLGAAWEWTHLMGLTKPSLRGLYLLLLAAVLVATLFVPSLLLFAVAAFGWVLAIFAIIFYPRGSEWWSRHLAVRALLGCWLLAPCFAAITYIRYQSDGIYSLLFLFILIWGADSAAYFVGKQWGKHKLMPLVSPGKSIEGLIGALFVAMLITLFAFIICGVPYAIWPWGFLLALITVLFSVVGDLFESMMKRNARVKDSGGLLPGHGGLLDRLDSLFAAAPIFVLGALLLAKVLDH